MACTELVEVLPGQGSNLEFLLSRTKLRGYDSNVD